ncbi:hypothetical protein Tco_1263571 [Tanacetum coccineum]
MQKEKEQQDKLNAVKAHLLYGDESEEIREIMKSPITPNPRRQPPEQSREGGMEVNTPEAPSPIAVSSEDSDETDLLHLGLGRRRRVVYSIGWGKRTKHIRTFLQPPQFPREGNQSSTKEASSQGHIAPRKQQIFEEWRQRGRSLEI